MLESNKNIDPIKNGFSQVKRKAPEFVWSNLDHTLSFSNDEYQIGKAFQSIQQKAPESTWNKINRQLIIDQVWTNIETNLDRRKRKFFWFYFAGTSVLLLLIGLILFDQNLDKQLTQAQFDSGKSNNTGFNLEHVPSTHEKSVLVPAASMPHSTANSFTTGVILNPQQRVLTNDRDGFTMADETFEVMESGNSSVEGNVYESVQLHKFPASSVMRLEVNLTEMKRQPERLIIEEDRLNKFEVGLIGGLSNSWIFNSDVREGLNRYSLIDNKFSIGYNAGINFVYNLSRSHAIGAQVDIFSNLSQRYDYFEDGTIRSHHITIRQSKFSSFYQFSFPSRLDNQRFNVKTGAFFSVSSKAEFLSNQESQLNESFSNYDFGLKAAFGSSHTLGAFIVEYGLNSDIGLLNISTSSSYNAKKFNYTTTYLLGGYLAVRYSF